MESSKERTLAYQLAKEIDHKDLEQVSGGNGYKMTSRATCSPTGSTGQWDTVIDISVDW
ncbi:bacteriocin [Legionella sp. CNM-1927-20]|uniref:bacteriocin n=1 Tax=Legionella sp. CNM-1927-20 TaxID=3422221 RepID=UPI00403B0375